MSRTRASAVVALLALAACRREGPDPRPWAIEASAGGAPLANLVTGLTALEVTGQGVRQGDGSLLITGATRTDVDPPEVIADVSIEFDARGEVAFPAVEGTVSASVLVDPAHRGPGLEPAPVLAVLLWAGALEERRPRFLLHESTVVPEGSRTAVVFNVIEAVTLGGAPGLELVEQWIEYDADECGLVYYDDLVAYGASSQVVLRRAERDTLVTVDDDPGVEGDQAVRWVVRHEESWHRDGTCAHQAKAYTQLAAWYAGP